MKTKIIFGAAVMILSASAFANEYGYERVTPVIKVIESINCYYAPANQTNSVIGKVRYKEITKRNKTSADGFELTNFIPTPYFYDKKNTRTEVKYEEAEHYFFSDRSRTGMMACEEFKADSLNFN
jgi:hypothetical protein